MTMQNAISRFRFLLMLMLLFGTRQAESADQMFPKVGDVAKDFELKTVTDEKIKLSDEWSKQDVVLIVLRGFPEYQCPVCNKQVGQFLNEADQFRKMGAHVIFVYPGPSKVLKERAQEFVKDKTIPDHFRLVIDPDLEFTKAYKLHWNAEKETAYPSTFVIRKDGKITFAKISQTHGGRSNPNEVLEHLKMNR